MAEERVNGDVEGARNHHLAQPHGPRLVEKLEGARIDGGADDLFEQVLGQVAQAVLRLALVPLEEDVVEDLPAIEVGGEEKGNPSERGCEAAEAPQDPLVVSGIERERVHQVRGNQGAVEIVESRSCQGFVESP